MTSHQHNVSVEVTDASYAYGCVRALDGLSLAIQSGVSFGLLGPNGAGKTTLIRLLVGLLKAKQGAVRVLGEPPSSATVRRIGYMPQAPSLYSELSARQNLDFFARVYGIRDHKQRALRVDEAIRLVDLWPRRNDAVVRFSGGMRQRISLACAIVHNPPLLILDEPTVGLDPELRAAFWEHFATLNHQGVTIVISSHTMDDAAHCDQLAFLRNGSVIAEGSPGELRQEASAATLEDAFLHFARMGSPDA